MARIPTLRILRSAMALVVAGMAAFACGFITAIAGAPTPVTVACFIVAPAFPAAACVLFLFGPRTAAEAFRAIAEARREHPEAYEDHGYQERFHREQSQKRALKAEGGALRRQRFLLRLWFFIIMPAGLITTAVVFYHVHPLWPYLAAWVASGPLAGLVTLGAAARYTARIPLLRYTCSMISYVTGGITGTILVGNVAALIHEALSPGWISARREAVTWQLVFAVLPAFLLCIVLRLAVARARRHDRAAGIEGIGARFGLD